MPADCCKEFWNRIPDDEPVFTLAARDILAPETIRFWLEQAEAEGVPEDKLRRARMHLVAIEEFQIAHPERTKVPD